MKTSTAVISGDLTIIFSLEPCDSIKDHFTFSIKTVNNHEKVNNKLGVTLDKEKTQELFSQINKLICAT